MKTKSAAESKLDEEFPALSSYAMKKPNASAHNSPSPSQEKANVPDVNPWKDFDAFNITSPDSFIQSDISAQDLGFALTQTLSLIPDAPYDTTTNAKATTNSKQQANNGFPKIPNLKLLQPEFFKKYDNQTLFFIFFYCAKTTQQYFAGCELRRRNWRFNTKYQTWFHRIGEPLEKTDQFEIAKFEYFDNSTPESWCVRVRSPFKFEYQYLDE